MTGMAVTSIAPFSTAPECAAEAAERHHLDIALLQSGLLHHQHAHHFAERFRVADPELFALQIRRGFERRIGHDDHHQIGERPGGEADDLDVLALGGSRDDRGSRDIAVAKIARYRGADRVAAAGAGDDPGDVDAVLLEEAFRQRDAIRRAGRIVLVLRDKEIFRAGRLN
jgi:hypothetical protein